MLNVQDDDDIQEVEQFNNWTSSKNLLQKIAFNPLHIPPSTTAAYCMCFTVESSAAVYIMFQILQLVFLAVFVFNYFTV